MSQNVCDFIYTRALKTTRHDKELSFFYGNCLRSIERMTSSSCFLLTLMSLMTTSRFQPVNSAISPVVVVVISDVIMFNNPDIDAIFENVPRIANTGSQVKVQVTPIISDNITEIVDQVCTLFSAGVIALVDMSSPGSALILRSYCSEFGVAYISLVDRAYYYNLHERNVAAVRLEPTATQMLGVLADIATQEKLNNIAIVYDDTFDLQNTPRRVLTNIPAQHVYLPMSTNLTELQHILKVMLRINSKVLFIIAKKINAETFLNVLTQDNNSNFEPNVFVLTKDSKVNCASCLGTQRVLVITAKQTIEVNKLLIDFMRKFGIDRDFDQDRIKVDEAFAFDVARLIVSAVVSVSKTVNVTSISSQDCSTINNASNDQLVQSQQLMETILQSNVQGVFGNLVYSKEELSFSYNMTLLVNEVIFEHGTLRSRIQVASWTHGGPVVTSAGSLIKSGKRMKYKVVVVSGIPPFVYKSMPSNETGRVVYSGYCIELLEKIAANMGFDYDIHDTHVVGSVNENGQWSGAIGELVDGTADLAVGPISVMAERETVIDFTVPFYDLVGLTILMKKPTVDYSLFKFLSVLDHAVWGCIIGAFILFSVLICVFDRLSPFSYQNRRSQWKEHGEEPRVFTLKEGIWFCMMSLTPQGGGETPKALSGRLIAATWWLFGFIIIATYTANLAAFLTVSRLETPIASLDDLSKQFKIQYAPLNDSTAMIYFKRMADIEQRFYEIWKNMSLNDDLAPIERAQLAVWDYPVSDKYTRLWETMKKSGFPESEEAGAKRILEGNFAFIADSTSNKYHMLTNCDLQEVGEEFSRKPYALAVPEGSPLRNELSNTILKLINNRTLEELKTKWWNMDSKSCPAVDDESDGISIRNIGGVFLVIVIGSGLSLITLVLECYWYRIRPERLRKKTKDHELSLASSSASTLSSPGDKEQMDRMRRKCSEQHGGGERETGLDCGFTNLGFEFSEGLQPPDGCDSLDGSHDRRDDGRGRQDGSHGRRDGSHGRRDGSIGRRDGSFDCQDGSYEKKPTEYTVRF
ncbi:unnamed protein product [Lymnaea stagnalis]|uniref:Uncharacterized protein n=1 Tax=Lymnaea stagnalis TaxID=6523 RepID=A0AAV2HZP4_LYMST